ncbi:hypothetical protein RUND412_010254 [Rhizina undulata]
MASLRLSPSSRALHRSPKIFRRGFASAARRSAPLGTAAARSYCGDLLRKYDYPSHLLTAFIHPRARDAYLAIRAFNVDIALIEDRVSNTTVGKMRMQFWRSAIEGAFSGKPPAEPVAVLLHKVLSEDGAKLSKGFFLKVIASREQYLGSPSFPTLDSLELYAESTYSTLSYLLLESLHLHSLPLDHVLSHIGKSTGIAAILRGLPLLASRGTVVLPLDVCAEFDLRQEDVIRRGPDAPGLAETVFKIATRANDHLITARKMFGDAGEEGKGVAFGAVMSAVPTAVYLERLEAVDFDPFHTSLQKRAWTLPWKAYRAYTTGQF